MSEQTYFPGTGRRKLSIAQVRLSPGKGEITVNGKKMEDLYSRDKWRSAILQPLVAADVVKKYNVTVKVTGGGITGQVDAIKMGIARALVATNEALKPTLRQQGNLLTRDPRVKERKKFGLRGARKAPQYTKR